MTSTEAPLHPREPKRLRLRLPLVVAAALCICSALLLTRLLAPPTPQLRIATGAPGGGYLRLGASIAKLMEERGPEGLWSVLPSEGSQENLQLLAEGRADLAIAQNDTPGSAELRTLAPLYEEQLHLVVRAALAPGIESLSDLRSRRVVIGAPKSGTAATVRELLRTSGLEPTALRELRLGTEAAIDAFARAEVDAVFVMGSLPSAAVRRLLDDHQGTLVALGNANQQGSYLETLRIHSPWLNESVIPVGLYGSQPIRPLGTLSVATLLVARKELDAALAREITGTLFKNRAWLMDRHLVGRDLREDFDASALRYALHEGARNWYRRHNPPFLVSYGDALSAVLALVLALISGAVALRRGLHRRKKDRIDLFYVEVDRVASEIANADVARLAQLRRRLHEIRREAFQALVEERIEANESFTIFQDFLNAEVDVIRAREERLARSGRPEGAP